MKVGRRGFLKLLGAGAAAVVAAPLITPSQKILTPPSAPLFVPSERLDFGVPHGIVAPSSDLSVVRHPILVPKPLAYFVDGDIGLKQTTTLSWRNVFLDAEEIAISISIPERLLHDADYDIWAEA